MNLKPIELCIHALEQSVSRKSANGSEQYILSSIISRVLVPSCPFVHSMNMCLSFPLPEKLRNNLINWLISRLSRGSNFFEALLLILRPTTTELINHCSNYSVFFIISVHTLSLSLRFGFNVWPVHLLQVSSSYCSNFWLYCLGFMALYRLSIYIFFNIHSTLISRDDNDDDDDYQDYATSNEAMKSFIMVYIKHIS